MRDSAVETGDGTGHWQHSQGLPSASHEHQVQLYCRTLHLLIHACSGISELLEVVDSVIRGTTYPFLPRFRRLVLESVMPLHRPNNMAEELKPVIAGVCASHSG